MIGRELKTQLRTQGHQTRALLRSPGGDYQWDARPGSVPGDALDWADALVSLNGASLTHLPWTSSYRVQIHDSRVDATTALAQAIAASSNPPAVWVSGSAVGIYGDCGDTDLDERSPTGDSFLADVVRDWERAASPAEEATRIVFARTGIVLGTEGALKPLATTTRLGLGARVGSGTQWWPWVSLLDEVRAIAFALVTEGLSGPVNIVGPTPATADEITRAVATTLHRPYLLRLPSSIIKLAMSGADELLLSSQKAHPRALLNAGFDFRCTRAEDAIAGLFPHVLTS